MRTTIQQIQEMKRSGKRFAMLTAYDYPTAKLVDAGRGADAAGRRQPRRRGARARDDAAGHDGGHHPPHPGPWCGEHRALIVADLRS